MEILGFISLFFGGAFAINGIPHFVSGVQGRMFPTPFAKPPGKGLSSPVLNVIWGSINFVIAYLLLVKVSLLDLRYGVATSIAAFGGLVMALILAKLFAKASLTSTEARSTLGRDDKNYARTPSSN